MKKVLSVEALRKSFDGGRAYVVDRVTFDLREGEVCALVGQSGSGKSTLLRLIAGLEKADSGMIAIEGRTVVGDRQFVPPDKRRIGLVFQDYALFPHMTVAQNIAFGIHRDADRDQRVESLLQLVSLEGYNRRYPHQLSGGEQQRVALARALAPQPAVLLLDEPFSNLDTNLKVQVRNELFRIIRATQVTCVFVTHDTSDAMEVADTIAVLHRGILEQVGTPRALFGGPRTPFIASLFGDINLLEPEDLSGLVAGPGVYGVRPNHIRIVDESAENAISAHWIKSVFMGDHYKHYLRMNSGRRICVKSGEELASGDDPISILIDPRDVLVFEGS